MNQNNPWEFWSFQSPDKYRKYGLMNYGLTNYGLTNTANEFRANKYGLTNYGLMNYGLTTTNVRGYRNFCLML